ncbi:MAG: hypothetical protein OK456_09370 [Thaumarchaeota archaeon]|nr:hypothetical protein [Nitrososphaerota archaeon]
MPQRAGIGRAIIALSIVILVLAGTLGLILVAPQSIIKEQTITTTTTVTSTVTPTQQEIVGDSFLQHLVVFSSMNVSAIIAQYEPSANVTWSGQACLGGIYPISGNNGNFSESLKILFDETKTLLGFQGFNAVFVGNVTRPTITTMTNGSMIVNSSFDLVGQAQTGNFTATVSAQDSYAYSTTSGTWLISQETWHFVPSYIPPDVLICTITAFGPRR